MKNQATLLPLIVGLSLVSCPLPAPADDAASARAPKHLYTNADLERVHPFRDETGARSTPAVPNDEKEPADAAGATRRGGSRRDARGEAYWRGEARKLRDRLHALSERREALRTRLAEGREQRRGLLSRARSSSTSSAKSDRAIEQRITAIERRMRQLEDDLAERARRAGALPGWLR